MGTHIPKSLSQIYLHVFPSNITRLIYPFYFYAIVFNYLFQIAI